MPEWLADPPWLLAVVYVLGGLWGLARGGDLLVDGSVSIARKAGLSPAVIGATIIAFGTSAPELVVSISAALTAREQAAGGAVDPNGPIAIVLANVVGSNICNIGLILGITLIVAVTRIPASTRRLDLPALMLATIGMIAAAWPLGAANPIITRIEALLLVVGLFAYVIIAIRKGRTGVDATTEITAGDEAAGEAARTSAAGWLRIASGLGLLLVAGKICLVGAVSLAHIIGLSERVIGLTVVAIGTSLPEFFASLQAARKGHTEIAIANVIGSNLFNILCVLGVTALIVPLPVNTGTLNIDLWWMCAFLFAIVPGILLCQTIGRKHGVVLILGFCAYTAFLLITAASDVLAAPDQDDKTEISAPLIPVPSAPAPPLK